MAENRIRKLGWLAPLALVVAGGLAACGDEDASETRTAESAQASFGSDQHLYNHAAEVAARVAVMGSDVHLHNQAAEIADTQAQPTDTGVAASSVVGSDVHLHNQAAEIAETPDTDAGPNVWEAGNRAVEASR
jgi:hypothetical protein